MAGPPTVENSRPVPDHETALVSSSGVTVCGRSAEFAGPWKARAEALRKSAV